VEVQVYPLGKTGDVYTVMERRARDLKLSSANR